MSRARDEFSTVWQFPDPSELADEGFDLVVSGADLAPGTLVEAYASGYFPMPADSDDEADLNWFSPDPRGVLLVGGLHLSRSLRRSARRFEVTFDREFEAVMRECGDPRREHGWINEDFVRAYTRLHEFGLAHSIEVWDSTGGLAGGLYGVGLGGFFAAESKFHRQADASKVAVAALHAWMSQLGVDALIDVQWQTEHLATLGIVEVSRREYLDRLQRALALPGPELPVGVHRVGAG